MASSSPRLLLCLSVLLGLFAIAAQARPGRHFHPCKTLIFFSTTFHPLDQNPSFESSSGGRSITLFFTEVRRVDPRPVILPSYSSIFDDRAEIEEEKLPFPFGLYSSSVGASFRDRTKDILSVVGSLLFGVGCGALTAATLYLIWSLFTPNRYDFQDSDDESDYEDDIDANPKKMGYVAIPAAEALVAVPVAKEVA